MTEARYREVIERARRSNVPAAAMALKMAEEDGAAAQAVQPHEPGDHHRYRIECEICGQRGTIRLSIDPEAEDLAIVKGRYYPEMPPGLPGETDEQYTDRLTGADGTDRRPYDHDRNRQCSIGYHGECSDPTGTNGCECPCHRESSVRLDSPVRVGLASAEAQPNVSEIPA